VPKLDELKCEAIIAMIGVDDAARVYLPDEYFKKKKADRTFLFNILNTAHPGFLNQVISHANLQRVNINNDEQKTQTILATDEWLSALNEVPFYSKVSLIFLLLTVFE